MFKDPFVTNTPSILNIITNWHFFQTKAVFNGNSFLCVILDNRYKLENFWTD